MAVLYFGVGAIEVHLLTRPVRRPFTQSPENFGLTFETVHFSSRNDGVPLEGWLLQPATSDASAMGLILVHGLSGNRQAGPLLSIAAGLVHRKHPVLVFDLRGTGRSGGSRTFGLRETDDVETAIEFMHSRNLDREGIGLLGQSFGGAIVIRVAAANKAVRAVVEDSGFADLETVVGDALPRMTHLPRLFNPGMLIAARFFYGLDLAKNRPIDAVQALVERHIPLLIIHGTKDSIVDVEHARRLANRYGPGVQTYLVSDAGHIASYERAPDAYQERIEHVFESNH